MIFPKLIILCGIPGSGKTTYAKDYVKEFLDTVYFSSDSIRKELYGDENIQGDPSEVFSLMQKRAIEALNNGIDVVYDATNVTRKDRASIINVVPKFVKIECHIIWAPIKECIRRDAERERSVGQAVIDKMLKRFQAPFYDEGIDRIDIVMPYSFNQMSYEIECDANMRISHDNPHHTLDICDHCEEAFKYLYINGLGDQDLHQAALWHDVGKPYVKSFTNNKGEPSETAHYYQHHCVGAWMYYGISNNVRVAWLISSHMEPFNNSKYYKNMPPFLKEKIDLLHEADVNAH